MPTAQDQRRPQRSSAHHLTLACMIFTETRRGLTAVAWQSGGFLPSEPIWNYLFKHYTTPF